MLFRSCAGGVVFYDDKLFLLLNEKKEWVLPKGVIRDGMFATEVAVARVKSEGGIEAQVLCMAGATSYEFYSLSRQKPVCNEITWYIMQAKNAKFAHNPQDGFIDGNYFGIEEALKRVTYSQDRSLIKVAYEKYKDCKK